MTIVFDLNSVYLLFQTNLHFGVLQVPWSRLTTHLYQSVYTFPFVFRAGNFNFFMRTDFTTVKLKMCDGVPQGGASDPWSFRAACQRSLLRRVASADAVTLCRTHPRRTAPHTTSHSSVYAWKGRQPDHVSRISGAYILNYINIKRNAPFSSRKRRENYGDGAAGTSGSSDDAFADAVSMPEREDVSFHLHDLLSINFLSDASITFKLTFNSVYNVNKDCLA